MQSRPRTDAEKKKLITEILGHNHSAVGKNFPTFSKLIDGIDKFNDAISFAELIPSLNTLLSSPIASSVVSHASFIGVLLFPVSQTINLINANQAGHKLYSYRAIAYTITAWAFGHPVPMQSARILSNIHSGQVVQSSGATQEFNQVWRTTSNSVIQQLNQLPAKTNITKKHVLAIFRALGNNNPDTLCLEILKSFEPDIKDFASKIVWKSNYKIGYGK